MDFDLRGLRDISGFMGACLVDSDTGLVLGKEGGAGLDLDTAAAGNTQVVRAKRETMAALGIQGTIEDILITLEKQLHLIRLLKTKDAVFLYVVLNKAGSNLGMARIITKKVEETLDLSKM